MISGFTISEDRILELDVFNFGDAPTRIEHLFVNQMSEYDWGGYDRYDGSFSAIDSVSIPAGQQAMLKFDLSDFGRSSQWSGTLFKYELPPTVRDLTAGPESERYYARYATKCNASVATSYAYQVFEQNQNPGLCRALEAYAIEYFLSKPTGFNKIDWSERRK